MLVVGHSAGGWLARATLDQGVWDGEGGQLKARDVVCGLVTLGAPHFPPPAGGPPCATRGALAHCDREMPGAHLANQGLALVDAAAARASRRPSAPSDSAAGAAVAESSGSPRGSSGVTGDDSCAVGGGVASSSYQYDKS